MNNLLLILQVLLTNINNLQLVNFNNNDYSIAWIPLALSAIGTGASLFGLKQTSDQMKQNEMLAKRQAASDKANNDKIAEALNKVSEAAKSNPNLAKQAGSMVAQNQINANNDVSSQQPIQQAYSGDVPKKFRFKQKIYGIANLLTKAGAKLSSSSSGLLNKAGGALTKSAEDWSKLSNFQKVEKVASPALVATGIGATVYGLKQSKDQMAQQESLDQQHAQDVQANNDKLTQAMNNLNGGSPTQTAYSAIEGIMAGVDAVSGVSGVVGNNAAKKDSLAQANQVMQDKQSRADELVRNLTNLADTASSQAKQKVCSYTEDNRRVLFNNHLNELKQKEYTVGSFVKGVGKNALDLGKATYDFAKKNKGVLIGGLVTGGAIGVADYGVNKYLQHKMKKDGIDMVALNNYQKQKQAEAVQQQQEVNPTRQYQRQYAYVDPDNPVFTGTRMQKLGKAAGHYAKESVQGGIGMGVLGGVFKNMGYNKQKEQLQQMMKEMEADKARAARKKYGIQYQPTIQQQPVQQRQYGVPGFIQKIPTYIGKGIDAVSRNAKSFKAHKRQSVLNFMSKMGQGGGLEGVNKFGNHLINYGKQNNNEFLQKTGNFIKNHQKTALAGSLVVGSGITAGTWDLGQKVVEKGLRKVDPNAYAYDDFQNQQVQ